MKEEMNGRILEGECTRIECTTRGASARVGGYCGSVVR